MTTVGLAGFGSAGRGIHAPLLQQAGMTIAAVSTSDPQRAEQVRADLPGARVVANLDAMLEVGGLDLIVLATPSGLHARQARQCIDAGIAVVVDKPLATNSTEAFAVVLGAGPACKRGPLDVPQPDRPLRRNPLCANGAVRWPSTRYAEEYGGRVTFACNQNLPDAVRMAPEWTAAARRRELIDLPERW